MEVKLKIFNFVAIRASGAVEAIEWTATDLGSAAQGIVDHHYFDDDKIGDFTDVESGEKFKFDYCNINKLPRPEPRPVRPV